MPVVGLKDQTFMNNENIQAVKIADSVHDMSGYGIFMNCTNLRFVILGENVESIGESCFVGCYQLEEIELNDGLKKIDELGLYTGSNNLKEIHLPESIIELDAGALNDWSTIYVKAGSYAEQYMEEYDSAIKKYIVE